jgi:hypothetical protein
MAELINDSRGERLVIRRRSHGDNHVATVWLDKLDKTYRESPNFVEIS